jgi:hypothetical protein
MDKKKRKYLIIAAIVLLLLLTAGAVWYFVLDKDDEAESGSTQSQTEITEEEDTTVTLPDWTAASSTEALKAIENAAKGWASDAKLLSCQGSVLAYDIDDTQYYIGGDNGEFSSWSCFVYSKAKKQDTNVKWYRGEVEVEESHYTWGEAKYEADPDDRAMYTASQFVDSSEIFDYITTNDLVDYENEYYTVNLGFWDAYEAYGNDPVWQVDYYSRTVLANPDDEYSQGKDLGIYFFEGPTGTKLK